MEKSDIERVMADMAFVRKVAAIGEHERASKMARHLLSRISAGKFEDKRVTELAIDCRRLLITELEEVRNTDDENDEIRNEIYKQSEILVDDLLLCRDIHGAIALLGQMADEGEHQRCWDALVRITNDFRGEIDSAIVRSVCTAFEWSIDICRDRGNDSELISQCLRFRDYLSWKFVGVDLVCKHICQLGEWFSDDGRAQLVLDMIAFIKKSRGDEIGLRLNKTEGDCFLYLGEHKKAISSYMDLVLYEKWSDKHNDYLLWIAETLTALDYDDKAGIFANEVIRRLGENSSDQRVDRAMDLSRAYTLGGVRVEGFYIPPYRYRAMRVEAHWREAFPIVSDNGQGMLELAKISFGVDGLDEDWLVATIRLIVFAVDPKDMRKTEVLDIFEQDVYLGRVPLPTGLAELSSSYKEATRHFVSTARERLRRLELRKSMPFDFCSWEYSGPASPWTDVD